MSPSTNETAGGLQLPAPIVEQSVADSGANEVAPATPEQAATVGQRAPVTQQANPSAPPAMLPLPPIMPSAAAQQGDVVATTQVSTPTVVNDGDLIEKEWVTKAKQIVERNRGDPYKQSEELTVFKADYMKKRYDKSIKLSQ